MYFIQKDGLFLFSSFAGRNEWTEEPKLKGTAYSRNAEDLKDWAESIGAEVIWIAV